VGLLGSVALLRRLSTWQPIAAAPARLPVVPDAKVYLVALLLAVVSGLLFGIVPVRQVLGANPYEIVKAGSNARLGRRMTVRDVLRAHRSIRKYKPTPVPPETLRELVADAVAQGNGSGARTGKGREIVLEARQRHGRVAGAELADRGA